MSGDWFLCLVIRIWQLPSRGAPWLSASEGRGWGGVVSEPHKTVTMRQFWVDYYPQGTAQKADWSTPPVFLREVCLLIQELWLQGQSSGLTHVQRPTEALSGNGDWWIQFGVFPQPYSTQFTGIIQKGAYILFSCSDVCICYQRIPLHHLALLASQD